MRCCGGTVIYFSRKGSGRGSESARGALVGTRRIGQVGETVDAPVTDRLGGAEIADAEGHVQRVALIKLPDAEVRAVEQNHLDVTIRRFLAEALVLLKDVGRLERV